MKTSLRALLVEDSEDDAMLVVRELRASGYVVTWERVETAATMRTALEHRTWDIVICDYRLPNFDGLAALKLLQEAGLDLPFIIVSGTIGEDIAVGAMKAGAHDYLMKNQLARLAPAVERELREAASRRERRLVGEALSNSEARYRRLFESAKDGILILNAVSGKVVDVNPSMLELLGHEREQLVGRRIWELAAFRNIVADQAGFAGLLHADVTRFEDRPLLTADGRRIEVEFVCTAYPVNRHRVMQCNVRDITGRKEAEAALRRSETELTEAQRIARVGSWHIDLATNRVTWTEELFRMYGLEPAQVSPDYPKHAKLFTPDSWQRLSAAIARARDAGVPYQLELDMIRSDGRRGWMLARGEPLRDAGGAIVGLRGTAQDITERKEAEAALRVGNAALEAAANAVVITDCEGRIEWANPAFSALTGYTLTEAKGRNPRELVKSGRHDAEFYRNMWTTILAGRVWRGTIINRRKNGSLYTEEMTITPIRNEEGRLTHFIAIKQDITERKQAEGALRKSEERFRNLAENISDWIWEVDETGVYTYSSPRCRDLLGYEPAEVLGRTPFAFMLPAEADRLKPVLAGLAARRQLFAALENICLHKDGRQVVLETSAVPIFDAEGVWRGFRGIDRDITERKQAEIALRQQHALVGGLLDAIPDYICIKDRQGRFIRINNALARHLGLREVTEAAGRTMADFFGEERARQAFADEQRIMDTGEPIIGREERETWPDGHVTWISTTKVPLRDAEGRITGLVGISRDISDRKRLEAQFLQAQKMEAFGQLAGGVAHDFNNILVVMLMQLNLLQMEPNLGEMFISGLAEVERAAMRGAGLTRQLLMFSRRQTMEPQILDLNLLLDDIARMLRRVLGEDIVFELRKSAAPLWIEADAGMVEQVVMNLCINARDAMRQGGRLTVETRPDVRRSPTKDQLEKTACLIVSDTGCGMDEATKARVFEPFFTTKPAGKGTGLGLATVYGIVQQHRGWVEVDSVLNQGSTFRVCFPLRERQPGEADEAAMQEAPRGHESILLVEDEEALRTSMMACLRHAGFRVVAAANGLEALKKWEDGQHEFDLLLTDYRMPEGMTGLQLATQLTRVKNSLKVIVMSGYIPDAGEAAAPWPSEITRLSKPFEVRLLLETVRRILDAK